MKIKNIISIDYNAYYSFAMIIVFLIGFIMFSTFLLFNLETEKYGRPNILFLNILFLLGFLFYVIKFVIRIRLINKILDGNNNYEVTIINSINSPRDQYNIFFEYKNKIHRVILKVSKRNKAKLNELCSVGNIVKIGYLENKNNKIIFPDLYINFEV